jgi:hypothetical protein
MLHVNMHESLLRAGRRNYFGSVNANHGRAVSGLISCPLPYAAMARERERKTFTTSSGHVHAHLLIIYVRINILII